VRQRLRVAQQLLLQHAGAHEFLLEAACADRYAWPRALHDRALGVVSPPMNSATPTIPSLPTDRDLAGAPSPITYISDTIEVVGK